MNNRRLISIVFNILTFCSLSYAGKYDAMKFASKFHNSNKRRAVKLCGKNTCLNNKRLRTISNRKNWEVRHFVCLVCQIIGERCVYKSRQGIVKHFKSVHELSPRYTCACTCGCTFRNLEGLKMHCETCGETHANKFIDDVFLPMTSRDLERIGKRKRGVRQEEVRKKRKKPMAQCSNQTIEQSPMANEKEIQLRKTMDAAKTLLLLSRGDEK